MINYKDVKKPTQEIVSVKCDVCGGEYDKGQDALEIQEFHHIRFCGGYASVFGDGTKVECDICQYCMHKFLGDSYRCEQAT